MQHSDLHIGRRVRVLSYEELRAAGDISREECEVAVASRDAYFHSLYDAASIGRGRGERTPFRIFCRCGMILNERMLAYFTGQVILNVYGLNWRGFVVLEGVPSHFLFHPVWLAAAPRPVSRKEAELTVEFFDVPEPEPVDAQAIKEPLWGVRLLRLD